MRRRLSIPSCLPAHFSCLYSRKAYLRYATLQSGQLMPSADWKTSSFTAAIYAAEWLHSRVVKTSPFHGGNTGSNPVGVIDRSFRFVIAAFSSFFISLAGIVFSARNDNKAICHIHRKANRRKTEDV